MINDKPRRVAINLKIIEIGLRGAPSRADMFKGTDRRLASDDPSSIRAPSRDFSSACVTRNTVEQRKGQRPGGTIGGARAHPSDQPAVVSLT